jgi:hypothetical protein
MLFTNAAHQSFVRLVESGSVRQFLSKHADSFDLIIFCVFPASALEAYDLLTPFYFPTDEKAVAGTKQSSSSSKKLKKKKSAKKQNDDNDENDNKNNNDKSDDDDDNDDDNNENDDDDDDDDAAPKVKKSRSKSKK